MFTNQIKSLRCYKDNVLMVMKNIPMYVMHYVCMFILCGLYHDSFCPLNTFA